eukprot:TRINITY_DN8166_c0_g1_i2.p1 TRINITY_DN8166_c0_g1~~TRINITY_DN8166_c0_g1_i2.p1  ORF type:complete len:306 (-),score=53.95 TRINITY_DN8166_c0_g1_i2:24-941(-)
MLFQFGIIADIQYADREDGWNFDKTVTRRYRNTLNILKEARNYWEEQSISTVIQLGDIIDGNCAKGGYPESKRCLDIILNELAQFELYNIMGNHELYNFSEEQCKTLLFGNVDNFYHDFSPYSGWRFVVLNSFEISVLCDDDSTTQEAYRIMAQHNHNDVSTFLNDWSEGLIGKQLKYLPYNGAATTTQLNWLRSTLEKATTNDEKVIVFSHVPICEGSSSLKCLMWNNEDILKILHDYDCVKAVLAGHEHSGGYILDTKDIHHVTLASPLHCELDSTAYGLVRVYPDRIEVIGQGDVYSVDISL